MSERISNPLYNDVEGYEPGGWRDMPEIVHSDREIKGFFGEYRWLSNFGKATIVLDGTEYDSVEKAYQAAKWPVEQRDFFTSKVKNEDVVQFNRQNQPTKYAADEWDAIKKNVMRFCLEQKFSHDQNPENAAKLASTGEQYLEETNWWNDTYWGKNLQGEGENNLGKLLMEIRGNL